MGSKQTSAASSSKSTSQTSPATMNRPATNGRHSSKSNGKQKANGDTGSGGIMRTKILMAGLRRSGKTSMQKVIFENMPPKQTFYLEPTMRVQKHVFDTVIPLEIWDCPGNITVETLGAPLSDFSSIIFVIDIRDLYQQPISKLVEFIIRAFDENPDINFEVFVHKAEKLQEDDKIENFRQIDGRITDRLLDSSPEYTQIPLSFHLTSIYDHTAHEAFSRVLHKLVGSLPYLEELLNVFCTNSQSPKAFLFDRTTRLYVATDASPVDAATHGLCCDWLQMLNSFGPLYKSNSETRHRKHPSSDPLILSPSASEPSSPNKLDTPLPDTNESTKSNPTARSSPSKHVFYPSASSSLSPGTPGTTLTYHAVTPQLALVALLPSSVYESRRGLVEYNVVFFREGVQDICEVEREARNENGLFSSASTPGVQSPR